MSRWQDDGKGQGWGERPAAATVDGGEEMADFIGRIVALKGTAMTIVVIMLATNRAFSKSELKDLSGISYRTIRQALERLAVAGCITEAASQRWRISDGWRGRFRGLLLEGDQSHLDQGSGKAGGLTERPVGFAEQAGGFFEQSCGQSSGRHFDQSGEHFDQPGEHFDQSNGHILPTNAFLVPSLRTVVVDRYRNKDKDIQQQQSLLSPDPGTAVIKLREKRSEHFEQPSEYYSGGLLGQVGEPFDRPKEKVLAAAGGQNGQPGDKGPYEGKSPHQEIGAGPVGRSEELAGYLRQAGITGRVYRDLLARPELVLDPAPVLAWYWYALAQEGIRSPTALAVSCLLRRDPPRPGYLALVRWWPKVIPEDRQTMEGMVQRNWGAEELAHYWAEVYAECTARSFIALKELYLAEVGVLGL